MNLVVKLKVALIVTRSGCPSITATLMDGVETLLETHIPEISEIVALNG